MQTTRAIRAATRPIPRNPDPHRAAPCVGCGKPDQPGPLWLCTSCAQDEADITGNTGRYCH